MKTERNGLDMMNACQNLTSAGAARLTMAALLGVVLLGCSSTPASAQWKGAYPYKAATTVGMVGDIVRRVAGDKAQVINIIGTGVDPHLYTPTRGDMAQLFGADIVFYSGLLLEGKMTDVFIKVGRQKPVYAVTELLDPAELLDVDGHHDPHVWMDVSKWMKATEAVATSLSEFDPANADLYRANAETYLKELAALDIYVRERIASIPEGQRLLITAHDAFNYMEPAYGLEVMGIQGLSTESEAGLQDINRLVDLIVSRKIPAVFVESSVSDKNVKALVEGAASRGHQVTIGGELFSDAMGTAGTYEGTYLGMIDHNATTIARALGGNAPERGLNDKLTSAPAHP
jgi:manganese/zinc/iron transport system substrate-binding protein